MTDRQSYASIHAMNLFSVFHNFHKS